MRSTIRTPQSPTEPLPELADCLELFHVHFTRGEGRRALDCYLTGLHTALPSKNCAPLESRELGRESLPDMP
ncbi:MAG: hypothetical protein U0790_03220 [Isosphaeraceae bacterium]